MNCRRRGPAKKPSVQVNVNPSKPGNGVAKKGDTAGMEWKPKKAPEAQKSAKIIDWK